MILQVILTFTVLYTVLYIIITLLTALPEENYINLKTHKNSLKTGQKPFSSKSIIQYTQAKLIKNSF